MKPNAKNYLYKEIAVSDKYKPGAFLSSLDRWKGLTPEQQDKKTLEVEKQKEKMDRLHQEKLKQTSDYKSETSLSIADQSVTWDNFAITKENEECSSLVRSWSPEFDQGLFLYGKCGTGKTHMCKSIINHFHCRKIQFRMVDALTVVNDLREGNLTNSMNYVLNYYTEKYCLMIDDIGLLAGSHFDDNMLYEVLERRNSSGKITFIVCDLEMTELKQKLSNRVYDRFKEYCIPVEIKGQSFRNKICQDGIGRLKAAAKNRLELVK